jgi:hypothetical protein
MKYNFSFLQVINWLFACKNNLSKFSEELKTGSQKKEDLIISLEMQKNKLLLVKEILNRKVKLYGISSDFLKDLKQIKKDYGIE